MTKDPEELQPGRVCESGKQCRLLFYLIHMMHQTISLYLLTLFKSILLVAGGVVNCLYIFVPVFIRVLVTPYRLLDR